jgi:AcrR family transcriptional regulator
MLLKRRVILDLRVKKTLKAIRESFWELCRERGSDRVKVNEICLRAMINRTTFYRHYEDVHDLAVRSTQEFFNEIVQSIEPPPKNPSELDLKRPPQNIVQGLTFVKENADFLRFALSENGIPQFSQGIQTFLDQLIVSRVSEVNLNPGGSLIPFSLIGKTFSALLYGAFLWWINRGCTPGIDIMAHYCVAILVLTPYDLLGTKPPRLDPEVEKMLRNLKLE